MLPAVSTTCCRRAGKITSRERLYSRTGVQISITRRPIDSRWPSVNPYPHNRNTLRSEPACAFDRPGMNRSRRRELPRHRRQPARIEEGETICDLSGNHQADGDDHQIEQPRPGRQQHHEEKEIDQHFDRYRPDRSVEAQGFPGSWRCPPSTAEEENGGHHCSGKRRRIR